MKYSSALLAAAAFAAPAAAIPSSGVPYTQVINGQEFELVTVGGPFYHYTTANDYLVTTNNDGELVYATVEQGNLVSTEIPLGSADEDTLARAGVKPNLTPGFSHNLKPDLGFEGRRLQAQETVEFFRSTMQQLEEYPDEPFKVKNLVVLLKFNDHLDRPVPERTDYEVLFNHVKENANDAYPVQAPTGSVREAYLEYSYGKLDLESYVTEWFVTDGPEKTYGSGDQIHPEFQRYEMLHRQMRKALEKLDADPNFNFTDFDSNNDGIIDTLTFIHSGYDASAGGVDAYNTTMDDRVWSHKWVLSTDYPEYGYTDQSFTSSDGIYVDTYNINPGVWSTSGVEITHRGVVAHELGHFFGLPDYYDRDSTSSGLALYGLMANSWGWYADQYHPQHFTADSKLFLGFANATELTTDGEYTIRPTQEHGDVYMISEGFPEGEYILIENRQAVGTDQQMPNPGIFVTHIDHSEDRWLVSQNDMESTPITRAWPEAHYEVRVIQPDGKFELEARRQPYLGYWADDTYAPPADYNYLGDSLSEVEAEVTSSTIGGINPYGFETMQCKEQGANLNIGIKVTQAADSTGAMKFQFTRNEAVLCNTTLPTSAPTAFPTMAGEITPAPTANWTVYNEGCVDDLTWFDKESEKGVELYNCAWYADEESIAPQPDGSFRIPRGNRCARYGDYFPNFGMTASDACCACGRPSPTPEPTATPTARTEAPEVAAVGSDNSMPLILGGVAAAVVVIGAAYFVQKGPSAGAKSADAATDEALAVSNPSYAL